MRRCPHKDEQRAATSHDDQQTRDGEKQQDEELEEGEQQEVSETNVTVSSCSSVSGSDEVVIDKSEVKSGVEDECEVNDEAQAESVEEKMDVLSQCTDDGRRDDDQWSDFSRGTDKDMYSVEQINYLLDETKGKAGVEVGDFFP